MKKIFICSPYRGNIELNIQNAKNYCKEVSNDGNIPIAPHLYFPQFLNDNIENERQLGIEYGKKLLNICDEIWIFGNNITEGMKQEIEYAKQLNKIIIYIKQTRPK